MARDRLNQLQPGSAPGPQQGYAAEPQAGPVPGWAQQPQAGPVPGYAQQPQAGPVPGNAGPPQSGSFPRRLSSGSGDFGNSLADGLEQAVADVALGAAARFIGRAISRRVQQTVNERVLPTLAARSEATLRTQIEIAERHPDLRACFTDKVIFLAGGSRVLPAPELSGGLTVEQADALVAQLRGG